jgi:2,3-dihydroxyphenylpropionate 1,2-dioxygenase
VPLNVDEGLALALLDAVRDADIDASLSYSLCVDHGFVQMWEIMRGRFADLPIIPIFVNAIGHPLPTYRRARLLGEAVGRFAKERRGRILFAASGGLSHDPVVPRIRGADQTLRDRLLGRTQLSPEQQKARETQVKAAGLAALKGEGPCRPLNPQWDRHFLGLLRAREWDALDSRSTTEVDNEAGAGANEALCWVAAAAALSAAAGSFDVIQEDYEVATGWIAGLAHVYAIGAACRS